MGCPFPSRGIQYPQHVIVGEAFVAAHAGESLPLLTLAVAQNDSGQPGGGDPLLRDTGRGRSGEPAAQAAAASERPWGQHSNGSAGPVPVDETIGRYARPLSLLSPPGGPAARVAPEKTPRPL